MYVVFLLDGVGNTGYKLQHLKKYNLGPFLGLGIVLFLISTLKGSETTMVPEPDNPVLELKTTEPELEMIEPELNFSLTGLEMEIAETELKITQPDVEIARRVLEKTETEMDIAGTGLDLEISGMELETAEPEQSEDEPFQDSGSEYRPSSSSDAEPEIRLVDGKKNPRKSKGQADPTKWKRRQSYTKRLHGNAYTGFKKLASGKCQQIAEREERKLSPRCKGHNIRKKGPQQHFECTQVSDEDRKRIFTTFWNLNSWESKKGFVSGLMELLGPKHRRRNIDPEESRKKNGFKYNLICMTEAERVKRHVCKSMFLGTLGIKEKAARSWVLKDGNRLSNNDIEDDQVPISSNYGIVKNVKEFLESLPKMESHYCRSSTKKLFVEPVWESYRQMHRKYVEICQNFNNHPCCWKTFMNTVNAMNIAIFSPKKDQCNTCVQHQVGNISQEEYETHIESKNLARQEKESDKESTFNEDGDKVCAYTVDLQAVLLAPRLNASANYYKTKLKVHNLTYYNLNDRDVSCFVWHEASGGLESEVFSSISNRFLTREIAKHKPNRIVVWSDGCGYQNKNVKLANELLQIAMENNVIIEQKYLTVGHTQMEADSIHSSIEKRLGRRREVYIPADYLNIIRSARQKPTPYYAESLSYTDFFQTGNLYLSSIRPGKKKGDPCVTDVCAYQYVPEGKINFKLNFKDEWSELPHRPMHTYTGRMAAIPLYQESPSIEATKFTHLQELKQFIPNDYRMFYDNLKHGCKSREDCPHLK